ncbi:MAG: ParB N-terminal domain-containing protein [Chloroflexi bacterium]|nr:ParB N-terminal domain-containing protein [Chloroflexota bacterium]
MVELPVEQLREACWNPNQMDPAMLARLRRSVERFGLVQNLVARPLGDGTYEVLSGNQRLRALQELRHQKALCVVVDLDDARARLLAQALNHLHGEDDLGLRAELVRTVLEHLPQAEVLALLPESAEGLRDLASLGQETIAAHLQAWQEAQAARLRHFQVQLTSGQLEVVEEALEQALAGATRTEENPNRRGNALYELCLGYLGRGSGNGVGKESP